jgi:hypothetical protein
MAKKNELAIIDPSAVQIIPEIDDMAAVLEELKDIERIPYGRITIASGGLNVFKVLEPGDETTTTASEIVGVILFSHKCNVLWGTKFGVKTDGPKTPDCSSLDGVTGVVAATGECRTCETCPYNQFGSADSGRGKACRNMRRLYIMREGDVFPIILSLPATSLKAFDFYRTRLAVMKKTPQAVLTKITLKATTSKDDAEFSVAVFSSEGALPAAEVARVRTYAAQFEEAAKKVDLDLEDAPRSELYTPSHPAPVNTKNGEFVEVESDEFDPFAPSGSGEIEDF